ncbi:hypothetical protein H3T86_00325 [Bifidobacterium sp. W8113]|uniref:hypothetical protein n=1 Tax=Bifidobacterium choladohabitans TaxID=2750947 RepID=UPI0018DC83D1|nr:hypothetical protein [Bifidobacterium choladohabitans]MBI0089168.1 hypothetical protein [Bifidobacterium choladohabitans]
MSERTRITCVSTNAAGFGAEQREETRIIPRQDTIQDLIDMLELTDTSDRADQIIIETEDNENDEEQPKRI